YNENVSNIVFPGGTSWSNPTTVSRYGSDVVSIIGGFGAYNSSMSYIVFNGLISTGAIIGRGAHHIRITNSEITNANAPGQGLQIEISSPYNEILNNLIHNNGVNTGGGDHGLYVGSDHNLFEGNNVYNNAACGFHLYDGGSQNVHDNIVRNNFAYGNTGPSCAGILVSNGLNNQVYNNVVYGNSGHGILSYSGATGAYIGNNTVYGNGAIGVYIYPGVSSNTVQNDLVYSNAVSNITNSGTATVLSGNVTTTPTSGCCLGVGSSLVTVP